MYDGRNGCLKGGGEGKRETIWTHLLLTSAALADVNEAYVDKQCIYNGGSQK